MRKTIITAIILFIITFILTYVGCCYFVPGWKLKLEADSMTYFLESIKYMPFVKCMVSLCVSMVIALIPFAHKKKEII